MAVSKIAPKQAQHDAEVADALIVCAYDSQDKFESNHLQGAISLDEFQSREGELSKDRELIFYCA